MGTCKILAMCLCVSIHATCGQLLPNNLFRYQTIDQNRPMVETLPTLPPHDEKALTARYLIHMTDWGSLATISTRNGTIGMPFANILSFSDGILGEFSGGVPYFYKSDMDVSSKDLKRNPAATLVVSEAQTDICEEHDADPQSPLCARVMLTGYVKKLSDPREKALAKRALFKRHPEMAEWPESTDFFFAKLDIKKVLMLSFYGGISEVSLKDYFAVNLYPA